MRFSALLSTLCAAVLVSATPRTAHVYVQPVESAGRPSPLAEISYDTAKLQSSEVLAYEAPDLPDGTQTVRVGLYDPRSKSWSSGTTVASTENFSKGFSPNFILFVDSAGEVMSTTLKGVQIDAGHTRDFGPKAVIVPETPGTQPALNKPVVLSPEGKREEPQEKTLLQKYVCPSRMPRDMSMLTSAPDTGGLSPLCSSLGSAVAGLRNNRQHGTRQAIQNTTATRMRALSISLVLGCSVPSSVPPFSPCFQPEGIVLFQRCGR